MVLATSSETVWFELDLFVYIAWYQDIDYLIKGIDLVVVTDLSSDMGIYIYGFCFHCLLFGLIWMECWKRCVGFFYLHGIVGVSLLGIWSIGLGRPFITRNIFFWSTCSLSSIVILHISSNMMSLWLKVLQFQFLLQQASWKPTLLGRRRSLHRWHRHMFSLFSKYSCMVVLPNRGQRFRSLLPVLLSLHILLGWNILLKKNDCSIVV